MWLVEDISTMDTFLRVPSEFEMAGHAHLKSKTGQSTERHDADLRAGFDRWY